MSILLLHFDSSFVPITFKKYLGIETGNIPSTNLLTCGFIPVKHEKVIKHNEDLCRTK